MADTCYGQPDVGSPDPSTPVAGEPGDAVLPDGTRVDVAPAPVAERQAAPPRDDDLAMAAESAGAAAAVARCALSPSSETTAESGEPRLALEQMSPVIDDGMLMVFGPDGDPVPPQAFADTAASRPDLQLNLPDGTAVRADRIAIVLKTQTLGRLGAAEQGDGWILTMLGKGQGPEPALEDLLQAELGDGPEAASAEVLAAEQGHCVLTLLDGEIMVANGGNAFRLSDVAPDAFDSGAIRLQLGDDTAISIAGLRALLRGQAARGIVDAARPASEAAAEAERDKAAGAPVPAGSERLVIPGCPIEMRPEGLWLGVPGLAGGGLRLARQGADGPSVPLVSAVSTTGETAGLSDLSALAFAAACAEATGPESESVDHDRAGIGRTDDGAHPDPARTDHPDGGTGAGPSDHDGAKSSAAPATEPRVDPVSCHGIASEFPSRDGAAVDHAAVDPMAEADQGALSRAELDLDGLAAITDDTLDLDLEFDLETESLELPAEILDLPTGRLDGRARGVRLPAGSQDQPTESLNGGPDHPPCVADLDGAGQDTSLPAGQSDGARAGCEAADQTAAAAPSVLSGAARSIADADPAGMDGAAGSRPGDSGPDGIPNEACPVDDVPAHVRPMRGDDDIRAPIVVAPPGGATGEGALSQRDRLAGSLEPGPGPGETACGRTVSCQADIDPESIALVVIRGVPADATLSTGARDEDGSWSISPLDLSSVMIRLADGATDCGSGREPAVVEGDLNITGIAFTEHGELVAISETVPLADYVGEPTTKQDKAVVPDGELAPQSEPRMIPLDVDPRAWAGEQFDALVVRDVPPGARLSAGSYDPSIDGWVLMPQDLPTLAIVPPEGRAGDFTLTLMGVALRPGDGNAARVLARLPVSPA